MYNTLGLSTGPCLPLLTGTCQGSFVTAKGVRTRGPDGLLMLNDGLLVLLLDLRGLTLLLLLWQVILVLSASPLHHLACDTKLCGVGAIKRPSHSMGTTVSAQGCKETQVNKGPDSD